MLDTMQSQELTWELPYSSGLTTTVNDPLAAKRLCRPLAQDVCRRPGTRNRSRLHSPSDLTLSGDDSLCSRNQRSPLAECSVRRFRIAVIPIAIRKTAVQASPPSRPKSPP